MKERLTILDRTRVPEWFDLGKYATAKDLDERGWLLQIGTRLAMEGYWGIAQGCIRAIDELDIPYVSDGSDDGLSYYLGSYDDLFECVQRHGVIPPDQCPYSADEWDSVFYSSYSYFRTLSNLEAYQFLYRSNDREEIETRIQQWCYLHPGSIRDCVPDDESGWLEAPFTRGSSSVYVGVDLNASDEQLTDDFRAWLKYHRELLGHPPRDRRFTEVHFRKWARYQILSYWDLQFWAMTQESHFTDAVLNGILFPQEEVEPDRIRKTTRKHTEDAKTGYLALKAQAASSKQSG